MLRGDKFLKFRRTNSNFNRSNQNRVHKVGPGHQQGSAYSKLAGGAIAQNRQQNNKSMQKTSQNIGSKMNGNVPNQTLI